MAAAIASQGGPAGLEDKEVIAMIAYLQRMGTDLFAKPAAAPATQPAASAAIGGK